MNEGGQALKIRISRDSLTAMTMNLLKDYSSEKIILSEEQNDESKDIKMYYFYILRSSDSSLYCGQTNNLQRRVAEHNSDKNKSAKYLRAKKPVKLIYFEEYPTLQLAMKLEWQVKKWTKVKKEALIKGDLQLLKKLYINI